MTEDLKAVTNKTIEDFGEQWQVFHSNPGFYGVKELLFDITGPLMPSEEIFGAQVAEIGSGTGRIVNMLLDAGAKHIYAIEPSAAMGVMKNNTKNRANEITYLQISGDELPVDLNLDLIFSIGVIHHIPDPLPVLKRAYQALKPGGKLLIWVYGVEGNKIYLSWVLPLRKFTKHLPHWILMTLASILFVFLEIYIFFCRFLPLPMKQYMREVLGKFPHITRLMTIYDQLNPAYAKYYYKEEAKGLVEQAGFKNIKLFHRHNYSWTVIGEKSL